MTTPDGNGTAGGDDEGYTLDGGDPGDAGQQDTDTTGGGAQDGEQADGEQADGEQAGQAEA